jgi:D-beta-D-heptose 7-phosphate kinase/D-beta-D-heptose 1-phosphate adenosyltransferase
MKATQRAGENVMSREALLLQMNRWRFLQKKIVFTNGCFDILHAGHLDLLTKAAAMGEVLVVGINSDDSVRRLKGPERPVNDEAFRARMLASLLMVDGVTIFDEDTPGELIASILPDILVKGGDYKPEEVVGGEVVTGHGGRVEIIPLVEGYSTTDLIRRIRAL